MNILLTFNDSYTKKLQPLLSSIADNTTEVCNIYIIHEDLSCDSKSLLELWVKKYLGARGKCFFIDFPLNQVNDLPTSVGANKWSKEIYFRLFAPYLIAECRCLYLDCDVIICSNIESFYHQSLDDVALIAVPNDTQIKHVQRLQTYNVDTYYNSGVLLINLDFIRENNTEQFIINKLQEIKDVVAYPDQDFINIVFKNCIRAAGYEYNYMASVAEKNADYPKVADVKICHYCLEKPWRIKFPYLSDKYWLKYYDNILKRIFILISHRTYRFYKKISSK